MKLTPDPFEEPHAEAERCLHIEGRPIMATYLLKEALKSDPKDIYLQRHLARINEMLQSNQKPSRHQPLAIITLLHGFLSWLFILSAFFIPAIPIFAAIKFFQVTGTGSGSNQTANGLQILLILTVVAILAVLYSYASLRLFVFAWFKYLEVIPPIHALIADKAANSGYLACRIGPMYTQRRKSFFALRYGR